MKLSRNVLLAGLLFLPVLSLALAASAAAADSPVEGAKWLAKHGVEKVGDLTLKEVAGLKTEWKAPDGKTGIEFISSFGAGAASPAAAAAARKAGKIPLRITADLQEVKKVWGTERRKRLNEEAHMYVFDSDGKPVMATTVALIKLCGT